MNRRRAPVHLCRILCAVVAAACLPGACRSPVLPPPGATGALIYELQLCANCHAADGAGTSRGPALRELGRHWEREELAAFLAAPDAWLERDPDLAARAAAYSSRMRSYDALSPDERLRLADWLLGL